MTRQEFSNTFTTLLNSYNTAANFGEEASKMDIVLDEYEKSVLLTQAQDIVTKSYFARGTNPQGEGFDESTRRQVDFSSLIKVALLQPTSSDLLYDDRGVLFKMPRKVVNGVTIEDSTDVLFILNEKLLVETTLNDGNPKTWTLNNYGDGTIKYYSEPSVTHVDKSHYWMIETDSTRYYEYPGDPTPHYGSPTYWTIQQDKRQYHYPVYPEWEYNKYIPPRWTIDDSSMLYYEQPEWYHHNGVATYWVVDLDPTQTHLDHNPGTAQEIQAVPDKWVVTQGTTVIGTYDEAVEVQTVTDTQTEYVITGYNSQGVVTQVTTSTDPDTPVATQITAESWYVDPNAKNVGPFAADPTSSITFTAGHSGIWEVTDGTRTYRFPFKPTFTHNEEAYWTIVGGDRAQYSSDPVSHHVANPYWVDEEAHNKLQSIYKPYYIINKPTYQYEDGAIHRQGYYINSNYGSMLGPFAHQPSDSNGRPGFQEYNANLDYWLIQGDTTNPSFTEIRSEKHIQNETWTIDYDGNKYIFYSQPVVTQVQQETKDTWSVVYDGSTYDFEYEPDVQHNEATYYWEFSNSSDSSINTIKWYLQAPRYEEYTSGSGEHYIIVYTASGTQADPIIYKDPRPTVTYKAGVPAHWILDGVTYSSEPHVIEHTGIGEYWTVNVTGSIQYDHEPKFHSYEAVPASWTITYDNESFDTEPNIITHEGSRTYWTFSKIDKEYYTENTPKVTYETDSDPSLNYYVINKEDTHYYGNGQPTFTITEGVYSGKSKQEYIIVPISYKEYDREMSKPYAQPLKKQAWRLFQNNTLGFDFDSELIPKFNINPHGTGYNIGDVVLSYRIRYVRRPRPIILEDLPNGLEIDGESRASDCELNPIVHMDILTKAVELALATRGRVQQPASEQRR